MKFLSVLPVAAVLAQAPQQRQEANRPVNKVIKLLNEMRTSLAAEQKEDADLFEKMECWCSTNRGAKSAAVEAAQNKIANLEAAIEGYTARVAQLDTEIKQLSKDIASNQDALAEARARADGRARVGACRRLVAVGALVADARRARGAEGAATRAAARIAHRALRERRKWKVYL